MGQKEPSRRRRKVYFLVATQQTLTHKNPFVIFILFCHLLEKKDAQTWSANDFSDFIWNSKKYFSTCGFLIFSSNLFSINSQLDDELKAQTTTDYNALYVALFIVQQLNRPRGICCWIGFGFRDIDDINLYEDEVFNNENSSSLSLF
jgi:hypothetical protein